MAKLSDTHDIFCLKVKAQRNEQLFTLQLKFCYDSSLKLY